MKIIWEPQDVQAGLIVGKSDRVERWLIGYDPAVGWADDPAYAPKWAMISLEDGMFAAVGQTREQLAAYLNHAGEFPAVLFPILKGDA